MPENSRPQVPARVRASRAALIVAVVYVAIGLAWIAVSDSLVEQIAGSSLQKNAEFQTIKGCAFIIVTGILLFLLVRRNIGSLQKSQVNMQQRLEGIAKQYQMLFQSSPSAMLICEPTSMKVLAANDVSILLFGYSRDEILALSFFDLLVEEERGRAAAAAQDPRRSRNTTTWQCRRRDRRMIFVETSAQGVDFDGRPAEIVLLIDVTERTRSEHALTQYRSQLEQRVADRTAELSLTNRKLRAEVDERHRIEADLRAATSAAEAANTAKSTFLANTSHEIRTPLTSILGYADLLSDPTVEGENRAKYLEVIQQNAQHLLALIDDLLDLSRAEMGKVRVVFDDHSPKEIAEQAVDLLRLRAEEKMLELSLRFEGELPATIHTDGVRLRQVLLNLLSNAIKFTPEGFVSLTVRMRQGSWFSDSQEGEAPADEAPVIRFEVSDTGIGMAPEHLQRVFEPFFQIEQSVTRRYSGSGLGLAISQQLASQMGGTLLVKSEPDRGSVFTLELPIYSTVKALTVVAPKLASATAGRIEGTILLAEDNPSIRRLVEEYLRRAGANVIACADGAQAVGHVERAIAAQSNGDTSLGAIDLVLLDLHMPVLDGAQALKNMRAAGYTGPIVGLSADYAEKSNEQWTRDGWDAMAAKPIDRQAFIPLLSRMLAAGAAGTATLSPGH